MISPSITSPIDVAAVKADFPILNQSPAKGGRPLAFLDSAASSQKPQVVIDALDRYYRETNANIHRGVYDLSEHATAAYEEARDKVAAFINARRSRECIFVRNTTEGINLVARSWGGANLREGDLVVVTEMEHHSNLVPWQIIAEEKGARIEAVKLTPDGHLDMDSFETLMAQEPKVLAVTHVSNSLGTVNPIREMIAKARAAGAIVVIDAAQSSPHLPIDVQALDCDFLAFSGHKMLGPMGIGVLYGKLDLLRAMPPYQGGGSMIRKVTIAKTTWADLPAKFEAGTPSVGDAVGLGVAIDYLNALGLDNVWAHEHALIVDAMAKMGEIPGVTLLGPAPGDDRAGVLSFTVDGIHPHDVAAILDEHNVAIRAGHHCTQPLMQALGLVATTRASFYVYNTPDDVDRLVEGVRAAQKVFGA
ncbi:MAG TPA: cysteine desulfurase [Thermomicrobiales bacterium]|nr:cysteine desulfurase [Thermomicrobiales bacterium]